jgi:hypothetical protein
MPHDGNYTPDLDGFIDSAIHEFERELETMWADPEEGAAINAFASRVAELMLDSSERLLVEVDPAFWRRLPELLAQKELHEDVMLALRLALARRYLPGTDQMAERCVELTRLVIRATPQQPVSRFLGRVARCYIAGFTNECIMVCRAVLENAVTERFDRAGVPVPGTDSGKSAMKVRIDAARMLKWLSSKGSNDAWIIWTRGNKAVHDDPEVVNQSLDTIRLTMGVLEELYAGDAA